MKIERKSFAGTYDRPMKNYLKLSKCKIFTAAVLTMALAMTGCGRPAPTQPDGGKTVAGMKSGCVGLGCEGNVSVGLKEKCVGMGCPPADVQ